MQDALPLSYPAGLLEGSPTPTRPPDPDTKLESSSTNLISLGCQSAPQGSKPVGREKNRPDQGLNPGPSRYMQDTLPLSYPASLLEGSPTPTISACPNGGAWHAQHW